MAAEVDLSAISTFTSLPETSVTTLLDNPTTELVKSLLESIVVKAREHDQLKSQKLHLEVELEQCVRTSESKIKVFKNSAEKSLAESSKLRTDLQQSENARSRLESEIEQVRSTTTQDVSESESLRSRISSLEASNRDTVVLLESKATAYEKLAQDLSAQHQKAVEFRKQIATLEQTIQTSNSTVANAKFKEQSLSQELDLAKKNNDWLETELKTKQADHTKFRKEKNARIAELSRSNEQYISEAESSKRSENAIRNRLEDQSHKVEELLQEIQQLREERSTASETFRLDLETANRHAELQKENADHVRERNQELSIQVEELRESLADEMGKARAEFDSERSDKEAAERRVAELELNIEQLQSELEQVRVQPGTPQRGVNGTGASTPLRPGTPTGIFGPATTPRLKGTMSMTQIYSAYKELERDLANERKAREQLQGNLDAMLQDLESNAPEIEELRSENSRLQRELVDMSTLVDTTMQEHERAIKDAKTYQGQAESKAKEVTLLTQQVRDASAQAKVLLLEQSINQSGRDVDPDELARARREVAEQDTTALNATGRLISDHLTVFKNISELEEQNLKMRDMLRQLGDRMENNESGQKDQIIAQLREEVVELQKTNDNLKDQLNSVRTSMKSFEKERNMFRGMITRKGGLPPHVDPMDFSRSLPLPRGGSPGRGLDESMQGSVNGGESDFPKIIRDMQTHFDSYRHETTSDNTTLRKQVNELSTRNQQLSSESIRTSTLLSSANQQYETLQTQMQTMKEELALSRKSRETAMETASKQELRTQQAAEELVDLKGQLDSSRREASNLKAEKDLWKSVEARLLEDTTSLRNERSRLDQLNGSLQSLLNEREQSDAETRRRLTAQAETLEVELQSTKRRLNEELEENKKAALRRDYEHEQSQKRIDDLVTSLGSTREELASAKTARDHLQARVDEILVELRSAEERLAVLTAPHAEPSLDTNGVEESSVSREQELAVEVSELKRDHELKVAELDRANEQVEVYKAISQFSEERLQELTDTNEQYREETEGALAEKDKQIQDLQQRVDDISSELNTTNTELSKLRDQHSEADRRLDEQKTSFEAEIARLREAEERSADQAQFNLEASKAQAQIATEAQQNYENELLKHAEAAKSLQSVRAEANQVRLRLVDLETQVKTTQTTLSQKEDSWSSMKNRYEQEMDDLKKRREEVMQQNSILHNQLENVTKQISGLQRDRAAHTEAEAGATPDSGREDMQEVVKYLRREKEIIEVQYHLAAQDVKRLRQQVDFIQTQLDETRLKLDQQRRAETTSEQNAMNHNKQMETLNELNLFRESSVTLRAEAKQASQALAEKSQRVEELMGQIEPLQARVAELENLYELREGEMKLLQQDRDNWQQRTQNILSKYDRVDPAELEELKGELEELKGKLAGLETERDEAVAAKEALQTQVDGIPEQLETTRKDLRERLGEQFKARSKEMTGRVRDKQAEVDTAVAATNQLKVELNAVKEELEHAKSQLKESAGPTVNGITENSDASKADHGRVSELESRISQLETSLAEKEQEGSKLHAEHENKIKANTDQMREKLNKRLADFKKEAQDAKVQALEELEEKLKRQHEAEMEEMRAKSVPVAADLTKSNPSGAIQESPKAAPQIEGLPTLTQEQARLLVQKNEFVRAIVLTNIKKRVAEKEVEVRKELGATGLPASTPSEDAAVLEQRFEEQKEAIIREKEAEFTAEKEALIKEHEAKLESEKQSIKKQATLEFTKESEKKIADQVALAEKRLAVKINMSDGRARAATAKLEVVKRAAEETPQKAVIEVWEIAKDAKAVPATPKPAATNTASTASTTAPASAAALGSPQPPSQPASQLPAPSNAPNAASRPVQANAGSGPAMLRGLQSSLPRGASVRGGRGGSQAASQIPHGAAAGEIQGSTTSTRGTSIPRGGQFRGRGGVRGGGPNVQTAIPSAPGKPTPNAGSPRASLNPSAQQFTPSNNKRAREDGEGVDAGNQGKRIRGASGGPP